MRGRVGRRARRRARNATRQDPQFEVAAVSTASGTCIFGVGAGRLHLTVMSAGRVIWDLADCARSDAAWVAVLTGGVPAKESVTWNRSISFPARSCPTDPGLGPALMALVEPQSRSASDGCCWVRRRILAAMFLAGWMLGLPGC